MSAILDYFDKIDIEVTKRKYYNLNKVNAVLEELREQAIALVDENERLKKELKELKQARLQTGLTLEQTREAYRETLSRARERADALVREAEEQSGQLTRRAEQKAGLAAKEVEACLSAVRVREEETIDFLNARLLQLKRALENVSGSAEPLPAAQPEPEENGEANAVQLQELEQKIYRLAQEISELESDVQE